MSASFRLCLNQFQINCDIGLQKIRAELTVTELKETLNLFVSTGNTELFLFTQNPRYEPSMQHRRREILTDVMAQVFLERFFANQRRVRVDRVKFSLLP